MLSVPSLVATTLFRQTTTYMSGRSANNEKAVAPVSKDDDDEAELARMGYKQELRRELSLLQVSMNSAN